MTYIVKIPIDTWPLFDCSEGRRPPLSSKSAAFASRGQSSSLDAAVAVAKAGWRRVSGSSAAQVTASTPVATAAAATAQDVAHTTGAASPTSSSPPAPTTVRGQSSSLDSKGKVAVTGKLQPPSSAVSTAAVSTTPESVAGISGGGKIRPGGSIDSAGMRHLFLRRAKSESGKKMAEEVLHKL